jgi:hypothetical protein
MLAWVPRHVDRRWLEGHAADPGYAASETARHV